MRGFKPGISEVKSCLATDFSFQAGLFQSNVSEVDDQVLSHQYLFFYDRIVKSAET